MIGNISKIHNFLVILPNFYNKLPQIKKKLSFYRESLES